MTRRKGKAHNEVLPGVASSWTNNEDFTSFTFNLQQGLTWADKNKTPLTANDFEFAIKRVLDPKTNSPLVHTLYCIKNAKSIHLNEKSKLPLGVSVIDKYTIKFDLESPYENFPKLLATPPTMPCNKDFFESCAGQYGLSHTSVICNGPFKIKNKYGWEHFRANSLFIEVKIPFLTFTFEKTSFSQLKVKAHKTLLNGSKLRFLSFALSVSSMGRGAAP